MSIWSGYLDPVAMQLYGQQILASNAQLLASYLQPLWEASLSFDNDRSHMHVHHITCLLDLAVMQM